MNFDSVSRFPRKKETVESGSGSLQVIPTKCTDEFEWLPLVQRSGHEVSTTTRSGWSGAVA
nr:hypothetical protein [Acidobacteriota bacterium]